MAGAGSGRDTAAMPACPPPTHDARPALAQGVHVRARAAQAPSALYAALCDWLSRFGLAQQARLHLSSDAQGALVCAALADEGLVRWAPGFDTLGLARTLALDASGSPADLRREIVLALLAAPQALVFDSFEELEAAVGVRARIAQAARRTALAFDTAAAERPPEYWHYCDQHGFLLKPGQCLIAALRAATQPEATGRRYDFSCYRATEYVILLGLAQELAERNPALLQAIAEHSRRRAIRSGQFHEVFLTEYGSAERPIPPRYYVPGDRVWFRNPDERSADIAGYEGSWVIYLGAGQFSNFWKREQPYDFEGKCVEIHHWRDGVVVGPEGELEMDETLVDRHTQATLDDAGRRATVLARMQRPRDPKGVYAEGGCIDTTREFPRPLCVGTADIRLPALV